MRSCARRALFSRPSSATGNPGGGLHRGLPRPVRGRAALPGAAPARAHLAVGVLRGPGAATAGPGGARRRAGETDPARLQGQQERYGAWKVWDQLNREGIAAARCTVERLMRSSGCAGAPRRVQVRTTRPIRRRTGRPGQRTSRRRPGPAGWWTSPSCHPGGHRLYRVVIDAFARLIPWRTAANHSTDLVLDALVMAVTYRARQASRWPADHHSTPAAIPVHPLRRRAGRRIAPSVGSVGIL